MSQVYFNPTNILKKLIYATNIIINSKNICKVNSYLDQIYICEIMLNVYEFSKN